MPVLPTQMKQEFKTSLDNIQTLKKGKKSGVRLITFTSSKLQGPQEGQCHIKYPLGLWKKTCVPSD